MELEPVKKVLAVFAALKEQVTPGEAEDVMAQFPKDLKKMSVAVQTRCRPGG